MIDLYRKQLQIVLLLLTTVTATVTVRAEAAPGAAEASSDPLLKAMQQELEREKALLLLPGLQRPYYMEYRVDDFETWDALASYGALTREGFRTGSEPDHGD